MIFTRHIRRYGTPNCIFNQGFLGRRRLNERTLAVREGLAKTNTPAVKRGRRGARLYLHPHQFTMTLRYEPVGWRWWRYILPFLAY